MPSMIDKGHAFSQILPTQPTRLNARAISSRKRDSLLTNMEGWGSIMQKLSGISVALLASACVASSGLAAVEPELLLDPNYPLVWLSVIQKPVCGNAHFIQSNRQRLVLRVCNGPIIWCLPTSYQSWPSNIWDANTAKPALCKFSSSFWFWHGASCPVPS
jgi:hypothetical protein